MPYEIRCGTERRRLYASPEFHSLTSAIEWYLINADNTVQSCDHIVLTTTNERILGWMNIRAMFDSNLPALRERQPIDPTLVRYVESDAADEENGTSDDEDDEPYVNEDCPALCSMVHTAPSRATRWACPDTGEEYRWCDECCEWQHIGRYGDESYVINSRLMLCDPSDHDYSTCTGTSCDEWHPLDTLEYSENRDSYYCRDCWSDDFDRCDCGECNECDERNAVPLATCRACGVVPMTLHILTGVRMCNCTQITNVLTVISRERIAELAGNTTPIRAIVPAPAVRRRTYA